MTLEEQRKAEEALYGLPDLGGKSEILRNLAEKNGWRILELKLANADPQDMIGYALSRPPPYNPPT